MSLFCGEASGRWRDLSQARRWEGNPDPIFLQDDVSFCIVRVSRVCCCLERTDEEVGGFVEGLEHLLGAGHGRSCSLAWALLMMTTVPMIASVD